MDRYCYEARRPYGTSSLYKMACHAEETYEAATGEETDLQIAIIDRLRGFAHPIAYCADTYQAERIVSALNASAISAMDKLPRPKVRRVKVTA